MENLVSLVIDSLNKDLLKNNKGLAYPSSKIKNDDIKHSFDVLVDTKNNGNYGVEVKNIVDDVIYFSTYFRKIHENQKFLELTGRKGILLLTLTSGFRKEHLISDYTNVISIIKNYSKMSLDVVMNSKDLDGKIKILEKQNGHPYLKLSLDDLKTI